MGVNMTREEAIRILDPETRRETMRKIPVMEWIETYQNACRLAVASLREQQAPAKLDRSRWEVCGTCSGKYSYAYVYDVRYCPNCGRPLTEEAWEELERRINHES